MQLMSESEFTSMSPPKGSMCQLCCWIFYFCCDPSLSKKVASQLHYSNYCNSFEVTVWGLPQWPPFIASYFRPAKRTGSWKGEGKGGSSWRIFSSALYEVGRGWGWSPVWAWALWSPPPVRLTTTDNSSQNRSKNKYRKWALQRV